MSKKLSKKEIDHITDYFLVDTSLVSADLCMVFGGAAVDQLADHAIRIHQLGGAEKFIVSGGVPTDDGRLEAHRLRDRMVAHGIAEEDILVEDQATNTGENVTYGMKLIDQEYGLENIQSVIAVGQEHASRRFLMTLECHWPDVVKMFTSPGHFNVPKKEWYKDSRFCRSVRREFNKIAPYKKQGFIKEVDMKAIEQRIQSLLQRKRGMSSS